MEKNVLKQIISLILFHIAKFDLTWKSNKKMKNKNKSQIWVETVVYTLIGLTIIGVLLAIANPQLEKMRDRSLIKQTIDAMNVLDEKISNVAESSGEIGKVNFKLAKGRLLINGSRNNIVYTLEDTRLEFSQLGKEIKEGEINITTIQHGNRFNVYLKKDYNSSIDISIAIPGGGDNTDAIKLLQAGPTDYAIYIENKGQLGVDDKTKIVFSIG